MTMLPDGGGTAVMLPGVPFAATLARQFFRVSVGRFAELQRERAGDCLFDQRGRRLGFVAGRSFRVSFAVTVPEGFDVDALLSGQAVGAAYVLGARCGNHAPSGVLPLGRALLEWMLNHLAASFSSAERWLK